MSRRQRYFVKQKLIGLCIILGSIIGCLILTKMGESDAIILPMCFAPFGLVMLFSKDMCWCDDYYFEVHNSKQTEGSQK